MAVFLRISRDTDRRNGRYSDADVFPCDEDTRPVALLGNLADIGLKLNKLLMSVFLQVLQRVTNICLYFVGV